MEGTSLGIKHRKPKTVASFKGRFILIREQKALLLNFTLQADIGDVNTIFKDLAAMVHEQGEMVDSIEANVETTSIRVNEGAEHLRQAERWQVSRRGASFSIACRTSTRRMCSLIVSCSIFTFVETLTRRQT